MDTVGSSTNPFFEKQIPAPQGKYAIEILRKFFQMGRKKRDPREKRKDLTLAQELFLDLTPFQTSQVISIFGGRGSGKTTLLLRICAVLQRKWEDEKQLSDYLEAPTDFFKQFEADDIVLPIIMPERFADHDTLAGWILAFIHAYVMESPDKYKKVPIWTGRSKRGREARDRECGRYSDSERNRRAKDWDLISEIRLLQRRETLISRQFAQGLAEHSTKGVDFSEESLRLMDTAADFCDRWDTVVRALLSVHEPKSGENKEDSVRPFLVIPIDDADLNPNALPWVLRQMRWLQHPRVVFLFTADHDTLRNAVMAKMLEKNNPSAPPFSDNMAVLFTHKADTHIKNEQFREQLDRRLIKTLPLSGRVELPLLTAGECLDFIPIDNPAMYRDYREKSDPVTEDHKMTFMELLGKIKMCHAANPKCDSMADYFDLSKRIGRGNQPTPPGTYDATLECLDCTNCGLFSSSVCGAERNPPPLIPTMYASALPQQPREMEQLYHRLAEHVYAFVKTEMIPDNNGGHTWSERHQLIFAEAAKLIVDSLSHQPGVVDQHTERTTFLKSHLRHHYDIKIDLSGLLFHTTRAIRCPVGNLEISISVKEIHDWLIKELNKSDEKNGKKFYGSIRGVLAVLGAIDMPSLADTIKQVIVTFERYRRPKWDKGQSLIPLASLKDEITELYYRLVEISKALKESDAVTKYQQAGETVAGQGKPGAVQPAPLPTFEEAKHLLQWAIDGTQSLERMLERRIDRNRRRVSFFRFDTFYADYLTTAQLDGLASKNIIIRWRPEEDGSFPMRSSSRSANANPSRFLLSERARKCRDRARDENKGEEIYENILSLKPTKLLDNVTRGLLLTIDWAGDEKYPFHLRDTFGFYDHRDNIPLPLTSIEDEEFTYFLPSWHTPRWPKMYDYVVYREGWNQIADIARKAAEWILRPEQTDIQKDICFSLLRYLMFIWNIRLVACIQGKTRTKGQDHVPGRRIPICLYRMNGEEWGKKIVGMVKSDGSACDTPSAPPPKGRGKGKVTSWGTFWTETLDLVCDVKKRCYEELKRDGASERPLAFIKWLEDRLPWGVFLLTKTVQNEHDEDVVVPPDIFQNLMELKTFRPDDKPKKHFTTITTDCMKEFDPRLDEWDKMVHTFWANL